MASLWADTPLLNVRSARVKAARRLVRRVGRSEDRLFLAEGPQAVREALLRPGCVREVFALPSDTPVLAGLRASAERAGVRWLPTEPAAVDGLTETVRTQGVVAVCVFLDVPVETVLAAGPLVVVCADVRDPGNAGTVIRCADAAGASGVVLSGSSVDPYNGKVVRASAGSLFHVPLAVHEDSLSVVSRLRAQGFQVLAADGAGELDLDDALDADQLAAPTAWLFGNEAHGLAEELAEAADHRVSIPLHGRAESLNLATAAAVCLYASARAQRVRR